MNMKVAVISDLHGVEEYNKAVKLAEALFSGKVGDLTVDEIEMGFEGIPTLELTEDMNLIDALVTVKAASSKREAREFIQNGAVLVNGNQEKSLEFVVSKNICIENKYVVIRRGKKKYYIGVYE